MDEQLRISDIDELFHSDPQALASHDFFDLIIHYIISPHLIRDLKSRLVLLKGTIDSPLLEYRMVVHDIRQYIHQLRNRFTGVIEIAMTYHHLQILLDRLFRILSSDALHWLDIGQLVQDYVKYLTQAERTKLQGYVRIL